MVTVWLFFLKFPDQSRKLSDHHSPRYAFRERFHDHFAQPLPELRFGARRGRRRRPLDHCRTAPASQIEPAFLSQLPISPGHRIVVNAEIQGELPDRRQLVAGAELASQEGSAEASNDLFGSRQTGGQVDLKQGRLVRHSLMYMYNILFRRRCVKPLSHQIRVARVKSRRGTLRVPLRYRTLRKSGHAIPLQFMAARTQECPCSPRPPAGPLVPLHQ